MAGTDRPEAPGSTDGADPTRPERSASSADGSERSSAPVGSDGEGAEPSQPTRRPDRVRSIGDRSPAANAGDLGYLYTLYRFYDGEERLLYLGRSERVRQKIVDLEIGHPRGLPLGHEDGPKPWWREATRIELEHLPPGTTESEARVEERRQIQAFRPIYNQEFNEDVYDRARIERAIDITHFEVDVATAEHERHDGVIRSRSQIAVEAERAAERLRPAGAARLRYGRRAERFDGSAAAPVRRPAERAPRSEGPGSVIGLILVLTVLALVVIVAVAVSVQVVL